MSILSLILFFIPDLDLIEFWLSATSCQYCGCDFRSWLPGLTISSVLIFLGDLARTWTPQLHRKSLPQDLAWLLLSTVDSSINLTLLNNDFWVTNRLVVNDGLRHISWTANESRPWDGQKRRTVEANQKIGKASNIPRTRFNWDVKQTDFAILLKQEDNLLNIIGLLFVWPQMRRGKDGEGLGFRILCITLTTCTMNTLRRTVCGCGFVNVSREDGGAHQNADRKSYRSNQPFGCETLVAGWNTTRSKERNQPANQPTNQRMNERTSERTNKTTRREERREKKERTRRRDTFSFSLPCFSCSSFGRRSPLSVLPLVLDSFFSGSIGLFPLLSYRHCLPSDPLYCK